MVDATGSEVRDPQTGLLTRVGLQVVAEYAFAYAHRDGNPLGVLTFDLRVGAEGTDQAHPSALAAVAEFATCVRKELRESDVVARTSPSQIAVLLTGADAEGTEVVLGHVAALVHDYNEAHADLPLEVLTKAASFRPASDDDAAMGFLDVVLDGLRGGRGELLR
jgi:GGDEF domain-containing protein